eukprot:TRINITY_DN10858_c0_g1_i1.p1 TRINITY_DN10858_c0_g1~~TRINITY_DN10858_c0_g1_i1.p1  ORF type:complete len:326 (+),score=98.89 TRINITY_DN10858_c0_g1_i1:59-1036(+)
MASDAVVRHGEVALAVVYFSISSIGMMTGNKVATNHLRAPSTLVILQAIATFVPLGLMKDTLPLQRDLCRKWVPVAALFASMLFTSMQSFLYATVSTILVFRNIATIISTVVEYLVRGKKANTRIVASEITIVLGCVIYGWSQLGLNFWGLFWIMANVAVQVAYGNLVKVYLCNLRDSTGKELSKYSCAYYNNVLAIPFFSLTFLVWGEHTHLREMVTAVSPWGWLCIGFTCVAGYFLATTGFGLMKLVSATTFLVVNNMVKIANILLGILFLNDTFSGILPIIGCVLSLGAGVWYSWEQNKLNEEIAAAARAAEEAQLDEKDEA